MTIVLIIYLVFILFWLLGVSAGAYHVFKYRIPADLTTKAFWVFLTISAAVLLFVVYFVSGADWGAF